MNIPVEEIRNQIPPENYGLLKWLQGNLYKTLQSIPYRGKQKIVERVCIVKPKESFEKGYDCVDAAKRVHRILNNHGIRSDVYRGQDELDIWDDHYFVKTDNEIVDAIDLYPIVGAKHFLVEKMSEDKLFESKYTIVPIEDQGPLCYSKPAKNTKLLCRVGISRVSAFDRVYMRNVDPTIVTLDGFLIERNKPIQRYEIETTFDEASLKKELDNSKVLPNSVSRKEMMKLFDQMSANAIRLRRRTFSLDLVQRGYLKERRIKDSETNLLLKEKTNQNLDTLASLTLKIPYAVVTY
jgi:hypothetical protein